jgi:hypothetical protein
LVGVQGRMSVQLFRGIRSTGLPAATRSVSYGLRLSTLCRALYVWARRLPAHILLDVLRVKHNGLGADLQPSLLLGSGCDESISGQ